MRGRPDWSVGQRLGAGFVLLLLAFFVLILSVSHWQARSERAQAAYSERIAPLLASADALERSILNVAIRVRGHLLEPDERTLRRYRDGLDAANAALHRLAEQPMQDDAGALHATLEPLVQAYLARADRSIREHSAGTLPDGWERDVSAAREDALTALEGLKALQQREGSEAMVAMEAAREDVGRGMLVASILSLLLLGGLAYFTAQSIRKPTRELLQIAEALRGGDWKPALEWAPTTEVPSSAPARNEMRRIAQAFGVAAEALLRREQRLVADRAVAEATASSLEKDGIATAALRSIVGHAGADVGVLYWREVETDLLSPVATHALEGDIAPVAIGEGIPGQAAHERRMLVLREIPPDSAFRVKLGHDAASPRAVASVPIVFRGELVGVLVVASLRDFAADSLDFLGTAATQLAIGFHNVRSHEEIERLLVEVSGKNAKIQAQNEELQAQHEELQAQSEEIQAQNEELRQQGDELQEHVRTLADADARKNEFLGLLAHELRNPMAAISNSLFLLTQAQLEGLALRSQTIIERQTQHLMRLIDDLLDVTRISRGQIQIQRERIDLVPVVRDCVEDQGSVLDRAGLSLELVLPDQPVFVDGDRVRLCQVVANLLHNAIKFSERGQRVRVSLQAHAAIREVAIHVVDQGIGIDPAMFPNLFQPFTQGDIGIERRNGGLGLGLSLVKALVDLHGGTIEARSEGVGCGAEFVVRLPLQGSSSAARAPVRPRKPKPSRRHRILLVEDNVDAAESLRQALELEGHEVEIAHGGAEGLELARRFRPDVLFCDLGLPTMDGYEVARSFRSDATLRSVFLVALTGYTTLDDKDRATRAGFDRHLGKPARIDELLRVLDEVAS